MNLATHSGVPSLTEAARFSPQEVVDLASALTQYIEALKHPLDWFKRQVFGQKSERRFIDGNDGQLSLGAMREPAPTATAPVPTERVVASHTRRAPKQDDAEESLSFFDATRVPMERIELIAPEAQGLSPDAFEVIGRKDSYRMAQRPASAVVLHFRRPVIKLKVSQAIVCASAPAGVIEGSRADVSVLAGLLVDKFAYHLPLYRQHQRLADAGITVSRPWLTQIAQQSIALLEPIYDAQFEAIRRSRVKAMDETPIKAGRAGPGKLKAAYFWPVYGQQDEVCFPFFETRRAVHGEQALGPHPRRRCRAPLGWLCGLCPVRHEDRAHPCAVLGAYATQILRGARYRARSGEPRSGLDRQDLCGGGAPSHAATQHGEEAGLPTHARQTLGRAVLRLGTPAVRGAGFASQQSADQGTGLCA